jgi:2-furoyl-CoA dehydrogenase large subunit
MEVPSVTIVDHCTPSPLTEFGQKGSGEAGYLGSPAAIASAINDAMAPVGAAIDSLPMTPMAIWAALRRAGGAAAASASGAGIGTPELDREEVSV